MKVLVTGYKGFVGTNLCLWLKNNNHEILGIDKSNLDKLEEYILKSDFIVHLAGAVKPLTEVEFNDTNVNLTKRIVDFIKISKPSIPIIFSSSIQVETTDTDYSRTKKSAEDLFFSSGLEAYVFRLTNIFGKWARPNYTSVVATFCYNIARDLPIKFSNENNIVNFIYIDDVCKTWIDVIEGRKKLDCKKINSITPIYTKTLRQLADSIYEFKNTRNNLNIARQDDDYTKKMYATYLSYLPEDKFSYPLLMHSDNRGSFTEFIRTKIHGQVGVNVIMPNITKGNHYHNTKNEKFLVCSGTCLIKFRKIGTSNIIEYKVTGDKIEVVDIPVGYTHNITNIGNKESIVVIWANEPYDENNPDTYFEEV